MPIFHAIILGLTQGLSEFLPISSSGHLILVPWLFGWHDFDDKSLQKAFDVALHIGTLIAVVAYFWKDLLVFAREGIAVAFGRRRPASVEGKLAWLLVLSAIPAAIAGALFEDFIDKKLGGIALVALSMIFFGLLLAWADRLPGRRDLTEFSARDALVVGAGQVLALNPGTSRSGITITTARWRKFSRDGAARISFLMSIPVTAGAALFKVGKLLADGIPPGLGGPLLVGIVTSAVAGWLAVWGTITLVRTHSFMPFVIYRVGLGLLVLLLLASPWR